MKPKLTAEFIMDWWLQKYHNISVKWLIENEPELIKSSDWYKKYTVTQEQHDEWYKWAIKELSRNTGFSQKYCKRSFAFDYLNCAPTVKKEP